jgi:hypothetical protein
MRSRGAKHAHDLRKSLTNSAVRVVVVRTLWDDVSVPLSEDEQRILSEIEAKLYETDPSLAKEVGSTTVYTAGLRSLRWATVGFIVGLIAMIATLSTSYWLAFVGFLIMLAAALVFERSARSLGKVSIDQLMQSVRASGTRSPFSEPAQRLRDRLKDDEEA